MAITYKIKEARVEHREDDSEVDFFYYVEINDAGVVSLQWQTQTVADIDVPTTNHITFLNTATSGTPSLS